MITIEAHRKEVNAAVDQLEELLADKSYIDYKSAFEPILEEIREIAEKANSLNPDEYDKSIPTYDFWHFFPEIFEVFNPPNAKLALVQETKGIQSFLSFVLSRIPNQLFDRGVGLEDFIMDGDFRHEIEIAKVLKSSELNDQEKIKIVLNDLNDCHNVKIYFVIKYIDTTNDQKIKLLLDEFYYSSFIFKNHLYLSDFSKLCGTNDDSRRVYRVFNILYEMDRRINKYGQSLYKMFPDEFESNEPDWYESHFWGTI